MIKMFLLLGGGPVAEGVAWVEIAGVGPPEDAISPKSPLFLLSIKQGSPEAGIGCLVGAPSADRVAELVSEALIDVDSIGTRICGS